MSTSGAAQALSADAAIKLCDAYLDGLTRGDLEGVLALFADNATIEDPVGTEIKTGTDELRAFYQIACDSITAAVRQGPPRIAGTDIAFAFVATIGSGPEAMQIDIIDVFESDASGKVAAMRAYWGPDNMRAHSG
ncbi:MAG: nuclear transport factor 2 family protein [Luminiphilus sp.]|jgi:steroid Delta-isomerase|nr:nuclear transport factor 2 family protein [Luminiphilus sp.]